MQRSSPLADIDVSRLEEGDQAITHLEHADLGRCGIDMGFENDLSPLVRRPTTAPWWNVIR